MIEIHEDRWLQTFIGRPAFRVTGTADASEACMAKLRELARRPAFSYARTPTDDPRALDVFQAAGFRVVDTTITLETVGLPAATADSTVRLARPEDAPGVEAVAREGFAYSRFHLDPHIEKRVADEIKAQWAGNYFKGARGDHMVVAEVEGRIAGFLQLLAGGDGVLTIDLVAVSSAHRRRGLAAAMIRYAAHACAGTQRLRVGTQAANVGSLRLYQSLGFAISATAYVVHCHGSAGRS